MAEGHKFMRKADENPGSSCGQSKNAALTFRKIGFFERANNDLKDATPKMKTTKELTEGTYYDNEIVFRVSKKGYFKPATPQNQNKKDYFWFHALDHTGEIEVACFAEQAEKFYKLIKFNRVYRVSNFSVRERTLSISNGLPNDKIRVLVSAYTIIEESSLIIRDIPFEFMDLESILYGDSLVNSLADAIGIVSAEAAVVTRGFGRQVKQVTIMNQNKKEVTVFLSNDATDFADSYFGRVIALKRCPILFDVNEKENYLDTKAFTLIWLDPTCGSRQLINEAQSLKNWFEDFLKGKQQEYLQGGSQPTKVAGCIPVEYQDDQSMTRQKEPLLSDFEDFEIDEETLQRLESFETGANCDGAGNNDKLDTERKQTSRRGRKRPSGTSRGSCPPSVKVKSEKEPDNPPTSRVSTRSTVKQK